MNRSYPSIIESDRSADIYQHTENQKENIIGSRAFYAAVFHVKVIDRRHEIDEISVAEMPAAHGLMGAEHKDINRYTENYDDALNTCMPFLYEGAYAL